MPRRLLERPALKFSAPLLIALLVIAASFTAWSSAGAQTFTVGSTAQVVTDDGGNLNMRAGASLSASIVTSLPDRSFVTIRDGVQQADGFTWQLVQSGANIGWVASVYLVPEGSTPSPTPPPSTTPPPSSTPSPVPTTPSVGTGTITGPLPTNGRPSLVVWGGGGPEEMAVAASARGCALRSVWATADGRLIGYQFGVPAFVNATWTERFGATLPPTTAIMTICGLPGQVATAPVSSAPSTVPSAGSSRAPVSSQTLPPGPGGNS